MLKRYAIIDGTTVVNVVEYDSDPGNPPSGFPANYIAVQHDEAGPGWTYENGVLIDTTPTAPYEPTPEPK